MECGSKKNSVKCPCTYPSCSRKGKCCECVSYHRDMDEIPACFFDASIEKTFDRRIVNFIRMRTG